MKYQFLIAISFLLFPIQFAKSMDTDVKVDIPIQELQQLLQQLDDISDDLVGQAGIQMRQTIDELNDKVEQQIGNIKDASIEVIQEASAQLNFIVGQLIDEANKLLVTVNDMIKQNIDCINQALAERIGQIKDSMVELLDKATEAIQNAVDRIYIRATQLVDTGSSRVATILDKTTANIIRIGLGIAIFLLVFWLIKTLYQFDKNAKNKVLKYVVMGLTVVLIGLFAVPIFSTSAIAKIAGQEIHLPKWENSCEEGNRLYDEFIELTNRGAEKADLKKTGDLALENLNWCLLTSVSPEIGRGTSKQIAEISALLYPPIASPSVSNPIAITCAEQNGDNSGNNAWVAIDWVSKYDMSKLIALENLQKKNVKIPVLVEERINPKETLLERYVLDVNKKVFNQRNVIQSDKILNQRALEFKYKDSPTDVKLNNFRKLK